MQKCPLARELKKRNALGSEDMKINVLGSEDMDLFEIFIKIDKNTLQRLTCLLISRVHSLPLVLCL